MKYKYLFWDVDGTLLDFPYSQRISITKCLEEIGTTPSENMIKRYSEINDSWWKRFELGEVTKEQLLTGRFTDLFEEFTILCEDVETFRSHYQEYLGNVYKYISDSLEICKELQGSYKQFVVTNGVTSTQQNKLKLAGFSEIMENVFISEQIGYPKPHIEFFEACFNCLKDKYEDFDRSQVLIIGDSLSSDIKGGNIAGIDTCWFNPNDLKKGANVTPTYEIKKLHEIYRILNVAN